MGKKAFFSDAPHGSNQLHVQSREDYLMRHGRGARRVKAAARRGEAVRVPYVMPCPIHGNLQVWECKHLDQANGGTSHNHIELLVA